MRIYWEPVMNRIREGMPCCEQWLELMTWNYRIDPENMRLLMPPFWGHSATHCPGCRSKIEIVIVDEPTALALPRYFPKRKGEEQ